ncbi:MAG: NUDIX hydrolase [Oscillospiraceae bacterium]
MHLSEKNISSERIYNGKIINLRKDTVLLENGENAIREVVEHPGGVCIVPINSNGEVLFVKQFRYPFAEVLLEIPAGKLEYGEEHFLCGKRELLEETGATAENFTYMGVLYPSVAYLEEKIHMYLAEGLTFGEQNLDADEFLDVVKIPLEKAVEMVMSNEIKDAKTQIAVLKTSFLLKK